MQVNLDKTRHNTEITQPIILRQGEKGQTLTFSLLKGTTAYSPPSGNTIKFKGKLANGNYTSVTCSISGSTVTCVTDLTMCAIEGRYVTAYLEETNSAGTIISTSEDIPLIVLKGADISGQQQAYYVPLIDALIGDLSDMTASATTLSASSSATAQIDKTVHPYVFRFGIPKGDTGTAATVSVGTTTTGAAGTSASVTQRGTSSARILDFTIPKGSKGDAGVSVTVGTTTTGAAGTSASVTNSGTASDPILNFTIPQGAKGDTGDTGTAATVSVGTTTTGAAGTSASVTQRGTSAARILDFTIPKGDKGDKGDKGETGSTGHGFPTGGTRGLPIVKNSSTDYDASYSVLGLEGGGTGATSAAGALSSLGALSKEITILSSGIFTPISTITVLGQNAVILGKRLIEIHLLLTPQVAISAYTNMTVGSIQNTFTPSTVFVASTVIGAVQVTNDRTVTLRASGSSAIASGTAFRIMLIGILNTEYSG